jgi:hypothetical protein
MEDRILSVRRLRDQWSKGKELHCVTTQKNIPLISNCENLKANIFIGLYMFPTSLRIYFNAVGVRNKVCPFVGLYFEIRYS